MKVLAFTTGCKRYFLETFATGCKQFSSEIFANRICYFFWDLQFKWRSAVITAVDSSISVASILSLFTSFMIIILFTKCSCIQKISYSTISLCSFDRRLSGRYVRQQACYFVDVLIYGSSGIYPRKKFTVHFLPNWLHSPIDKLFL